MATASKVFRRFMYSRRCITILEKNILSAGLIKKHTLCDLNLNSRYLSSYTNYNFNKKFHTSQRIRNAEGKSPRRSEWNLVYKSPLSEMVVKLKLITYIPFNTLLIYPVYLLFTDQSMGPISKLILATTCGLALGSSTFLYYWLSKVYVQSMFFKPDSLTFTVETSSYGLHAVRDEFHIKDVILVRGAGYNIRTKQKKYYLVDKMAEAQQIMKFIQDWNDANDDRE